MGIIFNGPFIITKEDFYKGRLENSYGLKVIIPNAADRKIVHQVIYNELCLGKIENDSRKEYLRIIEGLIEQGAEGVILGCTEIALLVKPEHTPAQLFDTTKIHALKAVEKALS